MDIRCDVQLIQDASNFATFSTYNHGLDLPNCLHPHSVWPRHTDEFLTLLKMEIRRNRFRIKSLLSLRGRLQATETNKKRQQFTSKLQQCQINIKKQNKNLIK